MPMNRRNALRVWGATVIAILFPFLMARSAAAGGLYTNEFSTVSQANAGAGRGAWVYDASASLHNPAAMTQLDDHSLSSGISLVFGDVEFDPDSNTPSGGGNGGNQVGIAPLAALTYVHKISDRFRFGLFVFSMSGSALDPQSSWAGRFEMTDISLLTLSVSPNLAYRVLDQLSIGVGPVITYGVLNWDLRAQLAPGPESNVKLEDLDDVAAAGRAGLRFHPSETWGASIYYQSKTDLELDGKAKLPMGITGSISLTTDLPLPQFVEVSGFWDVTDRLTLLGTVNWEDWSEADRLDVTIGGQSIEATTGFRDTWKIAVGANYRLRNDWLLQTGFSYDSSALRDKDRTTALPVDEQFRAALGAQHRLNDAVDVGFSFVYVNLGEGRIHNPTVRGEYEHNHLFLLGMTLSFRQLLWSGRGTF